MLTVTPGPDPAPDRVSCRRGRGQLPVPSYLAHSPKSLPSVLTPCNLKLTPRPPAGGLLLGLLPRGQLKSRAQDARCLPLSWARDSPGTYCALSSTPDAGGALVNSTGGDPCIHLPLPPSSRGLSSMRQAGGVGSSCPGPSGPRQLTLEE